MPDIKIEDESLVCFVQLMPLQKKAAGFLW
jgi:hypothetical protein